jgi:RHS repeat-associated protein
MQMPGRRYSADSSSYRYGFNGKENDNEVKGEGNQQDYGMRIYDPRLGRFLLTDPITGEYAELTPYQFASNTPIQAIDLDGLEAAMMVFPKGTTSQQRDEAIRGYNQSLSGFVDGFVGSAWSSVKAVAQLFSTIPTPENIRAKAALVHAVTHPKETIKNIKVGFKQWTSALKSSDPYTRSHALGQGLEFGVEFLIPIPLAKGAAGTKVAGRTVSEILDAAKGITTRNLLEDYALSTKAYKGFENLNVVGGLQNHYYDLADKFGNIVDVTSTTAKSLSPSQFYNKLNNLQKVEGANNRILQIYVKEGQYTAEQIGSLSDKLSAYIKDYGLDKTKTTFKITPIK